MNKRLINGKACPDWRPWSEEIKDDCCAHYGNHTGRCWYAGPYQQQECPWKGKRNEAPKAPA